MAISSSMSIHDRVFSVGSGADEDMQEWAKKINRGIRKRDPFMWRAVRNEKFVDMKQWSLDGDMCESYDFDDYEDRVTVNKVGSWLNSRLSGILPKMPRAVVRPTNRDGYTPVEILAVDPRTGEEEVRQVPRYRVMENTLNFILNQPSFGFDRTVRRFGRDGLLGYGAIRVGYDPRFRDANEDEFERDENGNVIVDPATGEPIRGELLDVDQWFAERVSYKRVVIDPDGDEEFRSHAWVAMEFIEELDSVKKDKRFSGTSKLSATAQDKKDYLQYHALPPDWEDYEAKESNEKTLVRYFEIIDLVNKKKIVLAEGHDRPLMEEELPEWVDHSDYVFFRPVEKTDEFYPKPPMTDMIPINQEYNIFRTMLMRGQRAGVQRKFFSRKDALNEYNKEQLESPKDLEVIEVDGDPNGILFPAPIPQMGQDFFAYGSQIPRDFDEVAGQASAGRGASGADTATEAAIIEQGSNLREDDMRAQLADALREVFKKLLDSIQANMEMPMVIAIDGRDGMAYQAKINPELIKGDYDVTVDVEEMVPTNSLMERAQFTQFLAVLPAIPVQLRAKRVFVETVAGMFKVKNSMLIDDMVEAAQQEIQAAAQMAQSKNAQGGVPTVPGSQEQMAEQQFGQMGGDGVLSV